jgi:hypothetical protein
MKRRVRSHPPSRWTSLATDWRLSQEQALVILCRYYNSHGWVSHQVDLLSHHRARRVFSSRAFGVHTGRVIPAGSCITLLRSNKPPGCRISWLVDERRRPVLDGTGVPSLFYALLFHSWLYLAYRLHHFYSPGLSRAQRSCERAKQKHS